jgi:predicted MFS family arabinose efflux permease
VCVCVCLCVCVGQFGLEPQLVGALLLPSGLGTMAGSVLGGYAADRACRGGKPVAYRLIPTACVAPSHLCPWIPLIIFC